NNVVSGPTTTILSLSSSSSSFLFGFNSLKFSQRASLKFIDNVNERKFTFAPLKCIRISALTATEAPLAPSSELVSDKLHRLATEFRALHEPIDRVKRLLHYAAILPPADESRTRAPENRVTGARPRCGGGRVDESGRADSDSEIPKVCSCLIYVLTVRIRRRWPWSRPTTCRFERWLARQESKPIYEICKWVLSHLSFKAIHYPKLCAGHRDSVIVGAKKNHKNKKPDTHSFVPKPEEATEFFPEAVLLKEFDHFDLPRVKQLAPSLGTNV
ncbi:sufe-like protein 2, partial [Quercus suber]